MSERLDRIEERLARIEEIIAMVRSEPKGDLSIKLSASMQELKKNTEWMFKDGKKSPWDDFPSKDGETTNEA